MVIRRRNIATGTKDEQTYLYGRRKVGDYIIDGGEWEGRYDYFGSLNTAMERSQSACRLLPSKGSMHSGGGEQHFWLGRRGWA
jgi:hypothetical protein